MWHPAVPAVQDFSKAEREEIDIAVQEGIDLIRCAVVPGCTVLCCVAPAFSTATDSTQTWMMCH